jgi:hypothetical protein
MWVFAFVRDGEWHLFTDANQANLRQFARKWLARELECEDTWDAIDTLMSADTSAMYRIAQGEAIFKIKS